jgi:type IX secretion system PorP/SprF family membrane protein
MEKKILAAALMICIGSMLSAQQLPLVSQLYFMRMLYNPALTGYNGSTNVYLYDREQWTALPGHPSTRGGMGEVSLWGDRSGVGVNVYDDVTSVINTVNAQLSYAQKIKLAKDHHLSLGVSVGLMQTRIDYSNLVATDLTDPNLLGAAKGGIAFDMNVGLAYQWKKLTVGFSVEHASNSNVIIADQLKNTSYDMERHYIGSASYEFSFKKETWNLEPSVLVKKGSGAPVQVDVDAMANYKRFLFLGIGYRLNYGISIEAAVRISQCVTLGYAYEYPIIQQVSYGSTGGTHEVLVGVNFDRWIKNSELKKLKHRVDSLEARMNNAEKKLQEDSAKLNEVDSLEAKDQKLYQDMNATKQDVSQASQTQKVQGSKIDELQNRMDSFEKELKAYRKHVKDKPVTLFPDEITNKNPISQGDIYKMDKVNFEKNSSYLKTESYPQLDKLATLMKANPNMKVKVMGHTDYIASDEYNMWLSERRAKRVADYLISKGVAEGNITSIGFGKRAPIADNSTEEGRAQNRRVEIEIVKK